MNLDGTLLSGNIVVSSAKPQKEIGSSVRDIMDETISNKVRFLLSHTPFSWGTQEESIVTKCYNFSNDRKILSANIHHHDSIIEL